MTRLLTWIVLAALAIGYTPTPAPVIQPGDPFDWDPTQCQSPPMAALVISSGTTHQGTFTVIEPDAEPVTFATDHFIVDTLPASVVKDPNDTDYKLATKSVYNWTWSPTTADIGILYEQVTVTDPGGKSNSRTVVVLVKENQEPVLIGCR